MASRRIFLDIEEALSREVRRISHHEARTLDKVIMRETFDPFSGEVISVPVEPEFYDSSADAGGVQYPHFFIRLMRTREDRVTGRVVPQYGKWILKPVPTSPKAFEIVLHGGGLVNPAGNDITTSAYQIRKVEAGFLIRLLQGNNIGTYIVDSITISDLGDHTISVSSTIVANLPVFLFDDDARTITISPIDFHTVKVGDNFIDSGSNTFPITAVDADAGMITIGGAGSPALSAGASIARVGNVLQNTDLSQVRFIVMDPSKPVIAPGVGCVEEQAASSYIGVSPPIPIDAFYMIRIDSKTRENHIDVLNRVWEEFNPPRTGLPVIERSALSADELLTADVTTGGSNTIQVGDNSNYKVGNPIFIFDDLSPSKAASGEGFERPFESTVVDLIGTDQIVLADVVPDTYLVSNSARIVSNAEFRILMFHLEDHVTKDVEGSQYWVHEFTFWVQLWVDRLEEPSESSAVSSTDAISAITDIAKDIEDIDTGHIYSEEF